MAERTESGRLFQREGAHELKALSPVTVLIVMKENWQSRSEGWTEWFLFLMSVSVMKV